MTYMTQRRNKRTFSLTVDEMLESPRFKLALEFAKKDDLSYLKAMLIELGLETMNVVRDTLIRRVRINSDLTGSDLRDCLKGLSPSDYTTFRIGWQLSPIERKLYLAKINGESDESIGKLLEKAVKNMGLS